MSDVLICEAFKCEMVFICFRYVEVVHDTSSFSDPQFQFVMCVRGQTQQCALALLWNECAVQSRALDS
jgi:hypothetical protein